MSKQTKHNDVYNTYKNKQETNEPTLIQNLILHIHHQSFEQTRQTKKFQMQVKPKLIIIVEEERIVLRFTCTGDIQ